MKAIVKSLTKEFEKYEIENITHINYVNGTVIITYIDGCVNVTKYKSNDVIIDFIF